MSISKSVCQTTPHEIIGHTTMTLSHRLTTSLILGSSNNTDKFTTAEICKIATKNTEIIHKNNNENTNKPLKTLLFKINNQA